MTTDGWTGRLREWTLLKGDRLVVAGCLLVLIFAVMGLVELVGVIRPERTQIVVYVFSALIGGNITLITVVLSINQLVLSRELGSLGELRDRIESVSDYRQRVEDMTGRETTPTSPSSFLRLLFDSTREQAQVIGGMVTESDDRELREEIDDLVSTLTTHMDEVDGILNRSGKGIFDVLSTTLETNYGKQIHHIDRIETTYGDELSDTVTDALDDLAGHLRRLDIARQYFKTLYIQAELASLSRFLLYVGVPAVISSVLMLLMLATPDRPTFPTEVPFSFITVAITVGLAPLAVLFAFVIRIATVAQLTAAITPFTTPEQER